MTEVGRAKIDGYRPNGLQGERMKTYGSEAAANRATIFFGLFDQGLPFTHYQHFLAVGTVGLACDAVPAPFDPLAPAARKGQRNSVGRHDAQGIHALSPGLSNLRCNEIPLPAMDAFNSFFGFQEK
jgi:hypothetical protein